MTFKISHKIYFHSEYLLIVKVESQKRRCSVWAKNLRFPIICLFMKSKGANFA